MATSETVVCPLGRYGKCYRLNPKLYRYYKLLNRAFWSLAVPLLALQILGAGDRLGPISWPHNLPAQVAVGLGIATILGQIAIAARGEIASATESKARLTAVRNSTFARLHRKAAVVSGLFLLVLVGIGVTYEVSTGKPVQSGDGLLLVLALAGLAYFYRARRKDDQS
jgi:hypothetical protein